MSTSGDGPTHHTAADDALEEELRVMFGRVDPVPERVLDAARGAFTWRTIDHELAELSALAQLTHDSLLQDDALLAGVRGPAGPRTVTFEWPVLTLEVEVSGTGTEPRRLVGQLIPPAAAEIVVELRGGGSGATGAADDLGRFAMDAVNAGDADARLRFTLADGSQVRTPWTRL
jgi:hypothetical protein